MKKHDMIGKMVEKDALELVNDSQIKRILEELKIKEFNSVPQLIGMFDDSSVQDLISKAVFSSDLVTERNIANKMLNQCIARLRLRSIDSELLLLRKKIEESSKLRDTKSEKQLIQDYKDLVEKEKLVRGELNES